MPAGAVHWPPAGPEAASRPAPAALRQLSLFHAPILPARHPTHPDGRGAKSPIRNSTRWCRARVLLGPRAHLRRQLYENQVQARRRQSRFGSAGFDMLPAPL